MVLRGVFCCHNKSETDRIQYNHVGVPFLSASPAECTPRVVAVVAACTVNVYVAAELDGWLERNNPWEITYRKRLMVYVATLYCTQWCTVLPVAFYSEATLCFDSRWNKWDAFKGMWVCFISQHVAPTLEPRRSRRLTMFENKVFRSATIWSLYFKKKQSKLRRPNYQSGDPCCAYIWASLSPS